MWLQSRRPGTHAHTPASLWPLLIGSLFGSSHPSPSRPALKSATAEPTTARPKRRDELGELERALKARALYLRSTRRGRRRPNSTEPSSSTLRPRPSYPDTGSSRHSQSAGTHEAGRPMGVGDGTRPANRSGPAGEAQANQRALRGLAPSAPPSESERPPQV